MPRRLIHILVGAAALRFVALGAHSLWLDEGATWSWTVLPSWGDTLFAEANHPPVWWLVTRAWTSLFGDGEASLRMPAAILGVVTVYLCWRLTLRLLHPNHVPKRGGFRTHVEPKAADTIALWVAGLVACSTFFTEYAQEARMYAALIAVAVALHLIYLRWLDRPSKGVLISYALMGALGLYTHYFVLWILAAHGVHVLWAAFHSKRAKDARPDAIISPWPMVMAIAAAGVLFVPWFLYLVTHYESISTGEAFNPFSRLGYIVWRIGAGPGFAVVDRPRLTEGIDAVLRQEMFTVVWTSVLWFIPLVFGFRALKKLPGTASFVLISLLAPCLFLLAVFPWFALIHERYLVFLAPLFVFLAVVGPFALEAPWVKRSLLAGLVVLTAVSMVAYHSVQIPLTPQGVQRPMDGKPLAKHYVPHPEEFTHALHHGHPYGKEPWKQAHAFIRSLANVNQPDERGDLVLMHPAYVHLVWDFYDRHTLDVVKLPRTLITPKQLEQQFGEALQGRTRYFLVLAHEETEDPDAYVEVVWQALLAMRTAAGTDHLAAVRKVPPITFQHSWGVRVAVFNFRRDAE